MSIARRIQSAIVVLVFCAGTSAAFGQVAGLQDRLRLVQPGATMEQVQALLGPPGANSFFGSNSAWQYCQTGLMTDYFATIWFRNGSVIGITTERYAGVAVLCQNNFRGVDWGNPPPGVF